MPDVPMHPDMPTRRWAPPRFAELRTQPGGSQAAPLLNPENPNEIVEEHFNARCQQFFMSDAAHSAEVEKIWQGVCEGRVKISDWEKSWSEAKGTWVVFARWSEIRLVVPNVRSR